MDKKNPYELDNNWYPSDKEPSDVLLSSIIEEVAVEANVKRERTMEEFVDNLLQQANQAKKQSFNKPDNQDLKNSSDQPLLIVVAGPNGSGKTSMTSKMLYHHWLDEAVYINPDIVAQEKFGDWNSPEAILKAARYCVTLREECLVEHRNMVIETVLSTYRNVDFIQRAIAVGFHVRLFFIATCDPTINAARVARRVLEGGHDVSITKIVSRYPKSIANCSRLSNIVDQLYVIDNSVDGESPRILFHKSKGMLKSKYVEEVPLWARAIL